MLTHDMLYLSYVTVVIQVKQVIMPRLLTRRVSLPRERGACVGTKEREGGRER
jgi:hypothetical protein